MFRKENYYSSDVFDNESEKLSKNSWWFLCHLDEISDHLDFITTNIFDRSVIVQNNNGKVIGFENICPHRFYQLKNAERGNGKLKCSAHGWIFNNEGFAVGIPAKNEIFKDLNKCDLHLKKIDIELCGNIVFAKLKSQTHLSLKNYLGEFHDVLKNISEIITKPYFEKAFESNANWKLLFEISLDEYHVSALHPETFGSLWGHFKMNVENHQYYYTDNHSSFF